MNLALRHPKYIIPLFLLSGAVAGTGCSTDSDSADGTGGAGAAASIGGAAGTSGGQTGADGGGPVVGGGGSSVGGGNIGGGTADAGGAPITGDGDGDGDSGGSAGDGDGDTGGSAGDGDGDTGGSAGDGDGDGDGGLVTHRACDGSAFPEVTLTKILDEGDGNVYVTSPPNDASRIFVVDVTGTLRIIQDGNVVTAGSFSVDRTFEEQGFHSIAFHPNFDGTTEKRLYVAYNEPSNGETRVMETTLDGDVLDTANFKPIIEQVQSDRNHNGGQLQFGPDGYLYFGFGDGGNSCDEGHGGPGAFFPLSQMSDHQASDLTTLLGTIVRVDVDNLDTMPAGNISTDGGQDGRIFHWGVRNPWRFSFDRGTNDLWIADVGQNKWEEVNVLPAIDGEPAPTTNFGWPAREGKHSSGDSNCNGPTPDPDAMEPIIDYDRDAGTSITGGYVYRGSKIPEMQGRYIYADYGNSRSIWTTTWDGEKSCDEENIKATIDPEGVLVGITSFGEDADGELYVAVANAQAGTAVYRIDPK